VISDVAADRAYGSRTRHSSSQRDPRDQRMNLIQLSEVEDFSGYFRHSALKWRGELCYLYAPFAEPGADTPAPRTRVTDRAAAEGVP
jgi:hypothetical protein